jgi:chemotaxis protein CheY-P-specific phosphatase CheC
VVFEMQGSLSGVIALVLTRHARDAVLEAMGAAPGTASALREVGNIVASQAVSAVADHLGGRITLSLPTLVQEDAARVVFGLLEGPASRVAVGSELLDAAGDARALLVFAPDGPRGAAI